MRLKTRFASPKSSPAGMPTSVLKRSWLPALSLVRPWQQRRTDMSRLVAVFLLALVPVAAKAPDPVNWTLTFDSASAPPGSHVLARLAAKIDPGWHLYSLTTPRPPIATTVTLDNPAVASVKLYQPQPLVKLDPTFQVNTETFSEQVT